MRIEYRSLHYFDADCDLLAYVIFEDAKPKDASLQRLNRKAGNLPASLLATGEFKAELHKTFLLHRPAGMKARNLLLLGGGPRQEFGLARLRELAGNAARNARRAGCRRVAFLLPQGLPPADCARVAAEGALYGNYEPDAYKTNDKKTREVEEYVLLLEKGGKAEELAAAIGKGCIVGSATNLARNLANDPANILTPTRLAEIAVVEGRQAGLKVEVLEREEMEKLGMNTLLAVSRGSDEPPKLIVLEIPGEKKSQKTPLVALLGKGVTFDSGGISLKPGEKMEEMKADMAGGAAVLGAMIALARLGTKKPVIGLIPAVENLPSGKATKPGDVVKSLLGKTVEIINTDAEGRLILADAIAYARRRGATQLVDVATLTGAVIIALGKVNAGMMGTDQKTLDRLRTNCSITGEKMWQLPLDKEYRKELESEVADIKNVGPRWGGAITAAKFLEEFAEDTPWVHLDIAGMDLDHDERPYAAKGATGFGVRTLVQLLV